MAMFMKINAGAVVTAEGVDTIAGPAKDANGRYPARRSDSARYDDPIYGSRRDNPSPQQRP